MNPEILKFIKKKRYENMRKYISDFLAGVRQDTDLYTDRELEIIKDFLSNFFDEIVQDIEGSAFEGISLFSLSLKDFCQSCQYFDGAGHCRRGNDNFLQANWFKPDEMCNDFKEK